MIRYPSVRFCLFVCTRHQSTTSFEGGMNETDRFRSNSCAVSESRIDRRVMGASQSGHLIDTCPSSCRSLSQPRRSLVRMFISSGSGFTAGFINPAELADSNRGVTSRPRVVVSPNPASVDCILSIRSSSCKRGKMHSRQNRWKQREIQGWTGGLLHIEQVSSSWSSPSSHSMRRRFTSLAAESIAMPLISGDCAVSLCCTRASA